MDRPHGDQKCGFVFGLKDSKTMPKTEDFVYQQEICFLFSW